MRHLLRPPLFTIALCAALHGAPTRVLVIGDSMSEEYAHELPFSAPDSNPTNPNTQNWIEIFDAHRGLDLDFGSDGVYLDLRVVGFEYNWGFPGATADFWVDVFDSEPWENFLYWNTTNNILDKINNVHVVVLMVGGNDVGSDYGNLYNNSPTPGFKAAYLADIGSIIATLRMGRPNVPIVLVNAPDVGATPDIQCDHPDPVKRLDATAHIADLNAQLAANHADDPDLVIVDLFAFTARIIDPAPITFGPLTMIKSFDRENRPNSLFCKEKFHPATGASAMIGNAIIEGINAVLPTTVLPTPITPLSDLEIAADVLGMQPYLDWIATFPGATTDMLADDDHDGLPTIGEFALDHHPLQHDAPSLTPGSPATLTFTPDPTTDNLVDVVAEESTNLQSWPPIPPTRLTTNPDGSITATLPTAAQAFTRLHFPLAP